MAEPDFERYSKEITAFIKERELTPIEAVLLFAQSFREVYGGKWVIKAYADGRFAVERA